MIRKFFYFSALLCSTVFWAQTGQVVSSKISWKAYKTLKSDAFSHYGTVALKAGNLTINSAGEVIGGNFVIDMGTIIADDETGKMKDMLERHLKSDDFFDVKKYPTVFFKLLSVKKANNKGFSSIASGNLTIKGITKKISFPVNIVSTKAGISFTSGTFTFNRHDFGLRYDTFEDMAISNDVEMKINITTK